MNTIEARIIRGSHEQVAPNIGVETGLNAEKLLFPDLQTIEQLLRPRLKPEEVLIVDPHRKLILLKKGHGAMLETPPIPNLLDCLPEPERSILARLTIGKPVNVPALKLFCGNGNEGLEVVTDRHPDPFQNLEGIVTASKGKEPALQELLLDLQQNGQDGYHHKVDAAKGPGYENRWVLAKSSSGGVFMTSPGKLVNPTVALSKWIKDIGIDLKELKGPDKERKNMLMDALRRELLSHAQLVVDIDSNGSLIVSGANEVVTPEAFLDRIRTKFFNSDGEANFLDDEVARQEKGLNGNQKLMESEYSLLPYELRKSLPLAEESLEIVRKVIIYRKAEQVVKGKVNGIKWERSVLALDGSVVKTTDSEAIDLLEQEAKRKSDYENGLRLMAEERVTIGMVKYGPYVDAIYILDKISDADLSGVALSMYGAIKPEFAKLPLQEQRRALAILHSERMAKQFLTGLGEMNNAMAVQSLREYTGQKERGAVEQSLDAKQARDFGRLVIRQDIVSDEGPFKVFPDYVTEYPDVVVGALGDLYEEYNRRFTNLILKNREWETDYRFCQRPDGVYVNGWVQIDMIGLNDEFLQLAKTLPRQEVRELLRTRIFEIENSLAMYQLLMKVFSQEGKDSLFESEWRTSLDILRHRTGKKIALLAITQETNGVKGKYELMRGSEFGKQKNDELTDDEVQTLSGFDKLFGPQEVIDYWEACTQSDVESEYLFYVRPSVPVSQLRDPGQGNGVYDSVLQFPQVRKFVQEYSVTPYLDPPDRPVVERLVDTKKYMSPMGMAFDINAVSDLDSLALFDYLRRQGVHPGQIVFGEVKVRVKPRELSYGVYGHIESMSLGSAELRHELEKGIKERGPYVLQLELTVPTVVNSETGEEYKYIHRNFMYATFMNDKDAQGSYGWLGGFNSLARVDSALVIKEKSIHGSDDTHWAPVI